MIHLPALPYADEALEPVISSDTMRLHHDKHHKRYVDETNRLAEEHGLTGESLEAIISQAAAGRIDKLRNNAAQAWNHAFFWMSMSPAQISPSERFSALKDEFVAKGAAHFGSGWVWLVFEGGEVAVRDTHDAGNFVGAAARPLLVCDLWEHAYYLDYQNDRQTFLKRWWEGAADWSFAEAQLAAASRGGGQWTFAEAA